MSLLSGTLRTAYVVISLKSLELREQNKPGFIDIGTLIELLLEVETYNIFSMCT